MKALRKGGSPEAGCASLVFGVFAGELSQLGRWWAGQVSLPMLPVLAVWTLVPWGEALTPGGATAGDGTGAGA